MMEGGWFDVNLSDYETKNVFYTNHNLWKLVCQNTTKVTWTNEVNRKMLPNEWKSDTFSFGLVL